MDKLKFGVPAELGCTSRKPPIGWTIRSGSPFVINAFPGRSPQSTATDARHSASAPTSCAS